MTAAVPREPVSPCLGICRLDPAGARCVGCLRTVEEIAGWARMGREEKRALLAELEERRRREARAPARRAPPGG